MIRTEFLRRVVRRARGVMAGYPGVAMEAGVRLVGPGKKSIAKGCLLKRGTYIWVGAGGSFTMGRSSQLGVNAIVHAASKVTIGDMTAISWNCSITDTDLHQITYGDGSRSVGTKAVKIGSGVLIGFGNSVLKGVQIGDGAVIAAGSVVTRSISAGKLAAGNPARELRDVSSWSR